MWAVQGKYVASLGWETVDRAETRAEALRSKLVYDREEPFYPHRIVQEEDQDD